MHFARGKGLQIKGEANLGVGHGRPEITTARDTEDDLGEHAEVGVRDVQTDIIKRNVHLVGGLELDGGAANGKVLNVKLVEAEVLLIFTRDRDVVTNGVDGGKQLVDQLLEERGTKTHRGVDTPVLIQRRTVNNHLILEGDGTEVHRLNLRTAAC